VRTPIDVYGYLSIVRRNEIRYQIMRVALKSADISNANCNSGNPVSNNTETQQEHTGIPTSFRPSSTSSGASSAMPTNSRFAVTNESTNKRRARHGVASKIRKRNILVFEKLPLTQGR
jgi:hypothetical protein